MSVIFQYFEFYRIDTCSRDTKEFFTLAFERRDWTQKNEAKVMGQKMNGMFSKGEKALLLCRKFVLDLWDLECNPFNNNLKRVDGFWRMFKRSTYTPVSEKKIFNAWRKIIWRGLELAFAKFVGILKIELASKKNISYVF